MNQNKEILKYCPNFYQIINFNPIEGDELTGKLIRMYQEYIFRINIYNEEEISEVKELDAALIKYLTDFSFRKEVQNQIIKLKVKKDCNDIIKCFIDAIVNIFKNYQDYNTRVIYISRWI